MNNSFYPLYLFLSISYLSCFQCLANETIDSSKQEKEKSFHLIHEKTEQYSFTPPKDWVTVDPKTLPQQVKILVKGKGENGLPPSLNLAIEETDMDLKSYLQTIKKLHESNNENEWKKLGSIQTSSGRAILTQIDTKTVWGDIRMMQTIILRNRRAYILTATALKDEFPEFYREFFQSIQSLKIGKSLFADLKDNKQRDKLEKAFNTLKKAWVITFHEVEALNSSLTKEKIAEKTFNNPKFQKEHWTPFQSFFTQELEDMTFEWQDQTLSKMKEELIWVR